MPQPPSPTHSTSFVVTESRATARLVREIAAHVLAISEVLPLPFPAV